MTILDALNTRRFVELTVRNQVLRKQLPGFLTLENVPLVSASSDFARYVAAMAERWPSEADAVAWPSVEEARWPFPDRPALFVWAEPIWLRFFITTTGRDHHTVEPFEDTQEVVSMLVLPPTTMDHAVTPEGVPISTAEIAHIRFGRVFYFHPDTSVSREWWPWGGEIGRHSEHHEFSHVTRFGRALVEALGHRLARLSEATNLARHERRAIARTGSPYRVLDLWTPDRATSSDDHRQVNWSKRWIVRGFWRNQPYGTGRELRRLTWIDPFIKGPADRPLDIRPEVFRLGRPEP
jgi:hypothetical protein